MPNTERAAKFFTDGYNCAQATAAAFADDYGLKHDEVVRMTAGFGGGMGGQREQCGAVSAMIFMAGIAFGDYDPKDNAKKTELYNLVKKMVNGEEFPKETLDPLTPMTAMLKKTTQ